MKKIDGRRKITPAQSDEIIRRHHAGEGASALAKEFGLAVSTVYSMSQAALIGKPVLTRDQVMRVQKQLGLRPERRGGKKVATKNAVKRARGKLTPDQRADVRRRRKAGETGASLAREFGVTHQAIDFIVKGKSAATRRGPLHLLELKHLNWLKSKLTNKGVPTGKIWPREEVRAMLLKKFGQHFNMRSHYTQLRWMGVEIGVMPTPKRRAATLKKRAKQLKADISEVLDAIKTGQVEMPFRSRYARGLTRRGRPPKPGVA